MSNPFQSLHAKSISNKLISMKTLSVLMLYCRKKINRYGQSFVIGCQSRDICGFDDSGAAKVTTEQKQTIRNKIKQIK